MSEIWSERGGVVYYQPNFRFEYFDFDIKPNWLINDEKKLCIKVMSFCSIAPSLLFATGEAFFDLWKFEVNPISFKIETSWLSIDHSFESNGLSNNQISWDSFADCFGPKLIDLKIADLLWFDGWNKGVFHIFGFLFYFLIHSIELKISMKVFAYLLNPETKTKRIMFGKFWYSLFFVLS